ncbi:hypothetical protein JCM3775_003820 [Rhodotorula graminis]
MVQPTARPPRRLSPAEAAQIPSTSLPIGAQISHLIHDFTDLSLDLFTILSSPSTSSAGTRPTAPIYDQLAAVDDKLARLLVLYDAHQAHQQRVDALVAQLGTLDAAWHASASTLRECTQSLAPVVESGALDRAAILAASRAGPALSPSSLLQYARLLAPFTSAPPSSLYPPEDKLDLRGVGATDPTGRSLPPGAIPPFPTEAVMRRGRLQFGREGLLHGLGETNEVGARREGAEGGAAEQASRPDAAARLEQEAKAHEATRAGAAPFEGGAAGAAGDTDDDEFDFDLDLNPDL